MLSIVQCRQAKPKAKPYKLTDSNGLYLEVRPSGGKFWRFRYEVMVPEFNVQVQRRHVLQRELMPQPV